MVVAASNRGGGSSSHNPNIPDNAGNFGAAAAARDDASSTSSESSDSASSASIVMDADEQAEAVVANLNNVSEERVPLSANVVRLLALLCACSLSVGSHYGMYFLGPLKSRLSREIGTSNTEFSLLLAAYNINNTWTPLVGGVMTARLGTAWASIIATSLILVGQLILLLGDYIGNVKLMVVGLFIFGLGISPLAVVQETIIVRFFCKHGLGVSLALGLVAGKGTSFLSAYTSYPLSQKYGPHAPFVVSTLLALLSFGFNIIYLLGSNWFTRGAGLAPEAADVQRHIDKMRSAGERMTEQEALEKVAAKKNVRIKDLSRLGDVFWLYIAVNVLCGVIWSPFTHLAANIFEKRYELTELEASGKASLLLAGSIVLYPMCGFLTDKLRKGPIVHHLFLLSSALTLFCYFWLVLPPEATETPMPAVLAFGGGHGFSTLLLVIIVPHLVPLQYVSTALGAHKSLESVGSTISKILAGLLLDTKSSPKSSVPASDDLLGRLTGLVDATFRPAIDNRHAIQWLLNAWLIVNFVQFIGTVLLWKLDVRRKAEWALAGGDPAVFYGGETPAPSSGAGYLPIRTTEDEDEEDQISPRSVKDTLAALSVGNPWVDMVDENVISSPDDPHSPQPQRDPRNFSTWPRAGPQDQTSPFLLPTTSDTISAGGRRIKIPSYTLSPSRVPLSAKERRRLSTSFTSVHGVNMCVARTRKERKRGKVFLLMSAGLVLATWALFFATAYAKISGTARR